MKDRIRQIMEAQQMTQVVFANYIGKSPATLSSIFTGRTRPTIDVVEAIKKKIPNINTDWLMFGVGEMFLPDQSPENGSPEMPDQGADGHPMNQNLMFDFDPSPTPTPQNGLSTIPNYNSVRNTRPEIERTEVKLIDKPQRRIVEIRVFYDDQTFDTFEPKKK